MLKTLLLLKTMNKKNNNPYPYCVHEHNYISQKEEPMFPIIDGWQTFKVTAKCEHCDGIVITYVKRINNRVKIKEFSLAYIKSSNGNL